MTSERSNASRGPDIPQRIVEQATRLFAARGFVGASLRDIAKAVGIRKPSLLYHFASKDELRQRVIEDMLGRWNEVLPKLLLAASSGSEQFDAVVHETLAFFRADPDRARLLLRELLDRPAEMHPLIEQHVTPWLRVVTNYIRKGQAAGRVRPEVDPEAYVFTMINLMVSGVAVHESVAALLEPGNEGPEPDKPSAKPPAAPHDDAVFARQLDELLRVAKASLFLDPSPDADARPRPHVDLPDALPSAASK